MNKFKVGDRVVKFKATASASITKGMEVIVIENPNGFSNLFTVSVAHIPELKDEVWLTSDIRSYVLAEIYYSPLYKIMREEDV